jgi:acetoin utilization deacetylase AcuC-like enzyme
MGFCLFNNIAIAAAHAIAEFDLERVLIVDWDVHHGNGTQHAFEDRRDVLFISSHQWPLWPGSGAATEHGRGTGEGFTVNLPLPPGFDDAGYISLFQRVIVPIAEQYRPQLVLVSAGFDAHSDDPLAAMRMTEQGYSALCGIVHDLAMRHADNRIALILEGGYDLNALARSVHACASALATQQAAPAVQDADHRAKAVIDHLIDAQRRFWRL